MAHLKRLNYVAPIQTTNNTPSAHSYASPLKVGIPTHPTDEPNWRHSIRHSRRWSSSSTYINSGTACSSRTAGTTVLSPSPVISVIVRNKHRKFHIRQILHWIRHVYRPQSIPLICKYQPQNSWRLKRLLILQRFKCCIVINSGIFPYQKMLI